MAIVLVVDDDADIRMLLCDYLKNEGHQVFEAESGPTAMEAYVFHAPDVIILDVAMPGYDGMEVCRRIRQSSQVPIIFLTARGDELDQLLAFGFGADDYVVKPFSPRAMVARIKAILKRSEPKYLSPTGERLVFGDIVVNPEDFTATKGGEEMPLTSKEFQLLAYLGRHRGKVLTKRQLVTGAWGEEYFGDDSSLMVHLSHLRQKLGDAGGSNGLIRTVRGIGYKLHVN